MNQETRKQKEEISHHKMKKLKTPLILAIIIMILLVSGCGPRSENLDVIVHEGIEGLEINFLERSPPDESYEGDRFPVTVELRNKGATDIPPDKGILVLGVEQEYVEIPSSYIENPVILFGLEGRSLYNPIGGMDRRTVELTTKKLGPQMEVITSTVAITTCYPYKTEATAQVCVDTDIYGEKMQEKVCTPNDLSMGTIERDGEELPRGQGAPIAVTKIEQKMLSHERQDSMKPTYVIHVQNMGNGVPIDIDGYEKACEGASSQKKTVNVVKANVFLSDRTNQLDCKPKLEASSTDKAGYIKLEGGEDTIKCELKEGILKAYGTFTTPLIIDLDYGYTYTISKPVLLKKQT
jgi:hypothetical protein